MLSDEESRKAFQHAMTRKERSARTQEQLRKVLLDAMRTEARMRPKIRRRMD